MKSKSKFWNFIKENYSTIKNFQREVNRYARSTIFSERSTCIYDWTNGENKPVQGRFKWDIIVKYMKYKHNVNVDLTWLEPQPETKSEPVTEQPQLDFDESEDTASAEQPQISADDIRESFIDLPASERVYQTREAATALIRRAYNIYELSKAEAGFGSNCSHVIGGYWPSVTIFHDSLGKCGSKVIDLNTESDLLKVSGLLDKLAEGSSTETDEELINRVFDGIDPKDMERVVTILQRKGGRDE